MFRDAETALVLFYDQSIAPRRVASKVPNPVPEPFVRAWRTGGSSSSRVLDAPIMTTQVWSTSDVDAAALAGILRDDLYANATTRIPGCRRIEEVSGLYYDPDPATEHPRYTFSSQLWLRARF